MTHIPQGDHEQGHLSDADDQGHDEQDDQEGNHCATRLWTWPGSSNRYNGHGIRVPIRHILGAAAGGSGITDASTIGIALSLYVVFHVTKFHIRMCFPAGGDKRRWMPEIVQPCEKIDER